MKGEIPMTDDAARKGMSVTGAVFLGVGAMVGAGIFALLGEAGAVAGTAVWLSFLIAGIITLLQGYSFAKLGARFPSRGGTIEFLTVGFGNGHLTGIASWMIYASVLITSAMVSVSFGAYAAALIGGDDAPSWLARVLSVILIAVVTFINMVGSKFVDRFQTFIVIILLVALLGLSLLLLPDIDRELLAPEHYPPTRDILSSVALTFFAYLGFSMVAFTGSDIPNPGRNLPRAMYISILIAIVTYLAISFAVFGTLPLDEVLAEGDTALAAAAEPKLGQLGYSIVALAAMLATSSSLNANLYAADGAGTLLSSKGQFPPVFGRKLEQGWSVGLLITACVVLGLALAFDLTAIASLGSAVALAVFLLVTISHYRRKSDTGANPLILILAGLTTAGTLILFAISTLENEPQTFAAMIAIFGLAVVLDLVWKWRRNAEAPATGGDVPPPDRHVDRA
jgi:amino acid transporter